MERTRTLHDIRLALDLPSPATLRNRVAAAAIGVGILLALWPLIVRLGRPPDLRELVVWLTGFGFMAAGLLLFDWARGMRRPAIRLDDVAIVLAPAVLALVLTLPNLTDPYFSAVGDEYAFWIRAKQLYMGERADPFTQAGVYGNHPLLSTYVQTATMKLFGMDQFGWRMSSAISLSIAAAAMAALGLMVGGRVAGLAAGLGVAMAHPLLAWGHTGYNNIQAVPLTIVAIALAVAGRKFNSRAFVLLAGVMAGFGWYTFYLSRPMFAVVAAVIVLQPGKGNRFRDLGVLLLGFVLAIIPLFASSGAEVITRMLAETPAREGTTTTAQVIARIQDLTWQAIQAPWQGAQTSHYISGPLLDQVTGIIVLVGLALAVVQFWRAPYRWIWLWYAMAILAGGATSQYEHVPNSRSFYILPPLILFGGLAMGQIAGGVLRGARWMDRRAARPGQTAPFGQVAILVLAIVGLVVGAWAARLNWQRLTVETPSRLLQSVELVAAMASEDNKCRNRLAGPLFVADGPEPVFEKLVDAYDWGPQVEIRKTPYVISPNDLSMERCIIAFGHTGQAVNEVQRVSGQFGRAVSLRPLVDGTGSLKGIMLDWKPGPAPPSPSLPGATTVPVPAATPYGQPQR